MPPSDSVYSPRRSPSGMRREKKKKKVAPETRKGPALVALMAHNGWTHIALLASSDTVWLQVIDANYRCYPSIYKQRL